MWSYRVIGHSWHNDLMVISRDGWMSTVHGELVVIPDMEADAILRDVEDGNGRRGAREKRDMRADAVLIVPECERPIQHRWGEAECGACKSFPWPSHALTGAKGILVAQAHHWHCNGNTFSWLVGLISEYCHYRPFLSLCFECRLEL
ncbi:hypothetical protein BO79DRAFT_231946 [Aspergillus costaricaensis CBS 115574]|uniref:Uncharacterized protein n=1 Tax=Aspergillus costaricaensis CBS 115574 TaxID=1448317 RepID=A0ACD1I3Y5_9EURO|nr:hypothetical protein BO79DRAFT_231946 [Aspergillus costaricaensis CBS 115574]RAK85024.1 hypothetical protein BO79DRAFT_231946 [Aspergillus costaricaensis CBS 115574]